MPKLVPPTSFPQDCAIELEGMMNGTIPFVQADAEMDTLTLVCYGYGQLAASGLQVSLPAPPMPPTAVAKALAPGQRGAFDWTVLIPGLINLLQTAFGGKGAPAGAVPAKAAGS